MSRAGGRRTTTPFVLDTVLGYERTLRIAFVVDAPRCRQGRGCAWRRSAPARCLGGHDVAAAAASPASRTGNGGPRSGRHRVAIIGAGAGGVAAAYFLAGTLDVDLFEARPKIGGHCDSHVIEYKGQRVTVDLGAQFFHPDTHPIYVTLLEELGLYDPAHPDADDTLEAPGSLCIFPTAGGPPIFSSSHPFSTLQRSIEFAKLRGARARCGSVQHAVGDHGRRLDPQPARQPVVQERGRVSVDHGVDRVSARRRAAGVGALDSADVRVVVSGRRRSGRDHVQLEDRPAGQPAAPAGPQPHGAGAPQHGHASADAYTRRLVPGDAGRPARAVPLCRVERAATCRTRSCCARCTRSRT